MSSDLSKRWGQPLRLTGAHLTMAELLQARGNTQGALEAIRHATQTAGHLSLWLTARVAMVEAPVCLRQGDTAIASHWSDSHWDAASRYLTPYEHWNARLLQARTELAQDRLDRALNLLGRIYRKAEERAGKHAMIGSLALRAVALQAQGELDQVMEALESALSMAEPEGYVRTFIDVGEPMAALLRAAASRGIAVDYVRRLLEPFGEVGAPSTDLLEPLTERELEVLPLLAAGLSNREIAAELFLAVGTVKKHTGNIYGKLDVHSRTQATGRARELGLI
jgi:LuxR family maltose regulon positive regulatory protein